MSDLVVERFRAKAEEAEAVGEREEAFMYCIAADEIERLRAEVERLRAAGDALADVLSLQSEWTCCTDDGRSGSCDCPPDVVTRPTDDSVATVLAAWEEARRER